MDFTQAEYDFLLSEFGKSKKEIDAMPDDDLLDIGDKCFDIEEEETVKAGDGELSERGNIAADLVTKINADY